MYWHSAGVGLGVLNGYLLDKVTLIVAAPAPVGRRQERQMGVRWRVQLSAQGLSARLGSERCDGKNVKHGLGFDEEAGGPHPPVRMPTNLGFSINLEQRWSAISERSGAESSASSSAVSSESRFARSTCSRCRRTARVRGSYVPE